MYRTIRGCAAIFTARKKRFCSLLGLFKFIDQITSLDGTTDRILKPIGIEPRIRRAIRGTNPWRIGAMGVVAAFLGVFLISRLLFRIQAAWAIWPIFPTVILFAVGVIIAITTAPTLLRGGIALLPPLLIVLGLLLGARRTP